jgi:hypothetical protein
MLRTFWIYLLGAALAPLCPATQFDIDRAKLLENPPPEIVSLTKGRACGALSVFPRRADFDRTRRFRYVIASYAITCDGRLWSSVRLFEESSGGLVPKQLAPDLSLVEQRDFGAWLTDIDNDGVPEIVLRAYGPEDNYSTATLRMFRWVEGRPVPISTEFMDTTDGGFRDINADGRFELITSGTCPTTESLDPPAHAPSTSNEIRYTSQGCPRTKIYFYEDGRFVESPERRRHAMFDHTVVPEWRFTLADLKDPATISESEEFTVQIGWSLSLAPARAPVSEIDQSSLLLARLLRPTGVRIKPLSQDEGCVRQKREPRTFETSSGITCFSGDFLEATFSRSALAKLLPTLELEKDLEVGDFVLVPLAAKMKNGDYVFDQVSVSILERGPGGQQAGAAVRNLSENRK